MMRIVPEVCPLPVTKTAFQGGQGLVKGGDNYDPLKVKCCLIKIWLYAGKPLVSLSRLLIW